MIRPILAIALVALALARPAAAQPEVDARRVILGVAGTTCTLRSGSGAPSGSLGAVCDVYVRTDSPYGIYEKTGGSTWSEVYRAGGTDVAVADGGTGLSSWTTGQLVYASGSTTLAGLTAVSSGQVLASNGTGAAPVYTASPSVTALTASGAVQGATVTGTTSVTTPTLTNSGNLALSPTGDVIFDPTGNDLLPTTGYDLNIGALTNKFLTLHAAELWVETLVAQNTMATIGGRILVGPTTTLTSDLSSGATSMSVKHNEIASGDRVVLQANGQVEWIAVTSGPSGSGPYTYSIARNQDGSGANDWTAGDAVFNTGTTGDGFIDLYSVAGVIPGSTAGPTIVGHERLSQTYSDIEARWAIGNLNGLYGYSGTTYGSAFGDPSATNVTLDATNGFRIRNGTTNKLTADTSGNLAITGDLSVGTAGVIRSGATAYGTGTGYWFDYNGGTPRFRVGTPSGNRLAWDGTDLTLQSANLTVAASGVQIAPSTSTTFSNTRGYTFSTTTGNMGLYGFDSAGGRHVSVRDDWTGVGDFAGGTLFASLAAANLPSSGGSNLTAIVAASVDPAAGTGVVQVTPSTYMDVSADLRIYANNSTTTGMPFMRSDGNYLVINSRPAANGGALYLNHDNSADIYLGFAGGTQYLYNPNFVSSAPEWAAALAQTTVGAAGAASALPATPAGYIKIRVTGVGTFVVPAYNP